MKRAVVVSAVRTGIGKQGGQYVPVPEHELGAIAIKAAVERANIDPAEVDDVVVGNLFGRNGNLGRYAYLTTGFPNTTGTVTVDRQCGSGSAAVEFAALKVMAGQGDIYIAAGVESMSHTPYQVEKVPAYSWNPPKFLSSKQSASNVTMPETADRVAKLYGVTRQDCDEWAVRSHQRAARATAEGLFDAEKVPVPVKTKKGVINVTADESIRPETTLEVLSRLPVITGPDGLVTAGNACTRADGAAAMVIMSEERAKSLGLTPLAYIRASAVAGLDPDLMSFGPVPSSQKVLKKAGLTVNDIDCWEINEAFAPQIVPCVRQLGMDPERVNPNGGAIAMGHPLGATGVLLATKLLYEMQRKDYSLGLVTMCIGGGQGMAIVYERV